MGPVAEGGRIKVLSLDLDGTIVDRGFAEFFWMELVPRLYAESKGVDLERAREEVYSAYDEVGPSDLRWYFPEYWFSRFGIKADPLRLIEENADRLRMYPDAEELLSKVGGRYMVVASTNSARIFAEAYQRILGIRFDAIISSVSDFGIPRKNAEFYRRAAAALRVDPGEVLHVGDDPERDLKAALEAGVDAYLVGRGGCSPGLERCVRDLREIARMLDGPTRRSGAV